MKTPLHTAGEWLKSDRRILSIFADGTASPVATLFDLGAATGPNGRLISAAPDLLAVAKEWIECLADVNLEDLLARTAAAVEKAEPPAKGDDV